MTTMKNNIREIRKNKGMTQSDVAAIVGTTQSRIADYENGKIQTENITLGTALKIAEALDTTIDELFLK